MKRRRLTHLLCEHTGDNLQVREDDPADRIQNLAMACGATDCRFRPCARREQFDRMARWNRLQWTTYACDFVMRSNDDLVLREMARAKERGEDLEAVAVRCGASLHRRDGMHEVVAGRDAIVVRTLFDERYRVSWSSVVKRALIELKHREEHPQTHHLPESRAGDDVRAVFQKLKKAVNA